MSELRAPIFNGSNYDFWRIKMCTIFKSHRLWEIVEQGFETPVKKEGDDALSVAQKLTLEENIAKDAKALGLIQSAVSDDIFPRIALQETAKDAWTILQNEFRGDKKVRSVRLQALRRDFEYMRMQDDESLSGYISTLLELVNQMKSYGETISDQRIVQKLLISLTRDYDSIAEVIEETKDTETIGVQEVIGSLKSHEQRLQRHTEKMLEKAFSSLSVSPREQSNSGKGGSSKSKKSWKSQKGKKWDAKPETNFRKENQNEGVKVPCKTCDKLHYGACWFKGKPKCYNCDKFGHLAKECRGKSAQTAHYATHKKEEGTMF